MRKNIVLVVCLLLVLTFAAGPLHAKRKVSPLSKEFVNPPVSLDMRTTGSHALGYRPDPADMSHLRPVTPPIDKYDATFDLRGLGKLSPIRDQANCGSCWAFASMASLESYLRPGEALDFSEEDLNTNHGFDPASCAGGNRTMSMAYMTRWSGPLSEADVPYPDYPFAINGNGFTPLKHVQQLNYLPNRANKTDNDTIKYFLTTYGAVQVSYYHHDGWYNPATYSYYMQSTTSTNHAVAIVGWDDNFSATNFVDTPPGNGAFIVRNSWGSSWGDGGYFYMSYYDTSANYFTSFNNAESAANYQYNYQHDLFGNIYGYGWGSAGHETAWGANIFTATNPLSIKAVGFFANDVNAGYEIYVYTGVTAGAPVSGTLAATKTGTHTYAGFYTVQLDAPVSVADGELFSVVVKFVNSKYAYPVPTDGVVSGFSSACTSNSGESFYSDDGLDWIDLVVDAPGYEMNCNIKAYADDPIPTPTLTLTSPNGWEHWNLGESSNITWNAENYTGTVRLVLFKNGVRFGNIAGNIDAADGSFTWTTGQTIESGQATAGTDFRLYLRSTDNTIIDASDMRFALIAASQLELTSPNGGEAWNQGSTQTITWNDNGYMGNVRLILFNKATKIGQIHTGLIPASQGSYSWTVGEHGGGTAPAGDNYSIRLLAADGSQEDYSDAPFSIIAP